MWGVSTPCLWRCLNCYHLVARASASRHSYDRANLYQKQQCWQPQTIALRATPPGSVLPFVSSGELRQWSLELSDSWASFLFVLMPWPSEQGHRKIWGKWGCRMRRGRFIHLQNTKSGARTLHDCTGNECWNQREAWGYVRVTFKSVFERLKVLHRRVFDTQPTWTSELILQLWITSTSLV